MAKSPLVVDYAHVEYIAYPLPDNSYDMFMPSVVDGMDDMFVGNLSEDEWLEALVNNSLVELDWFEADVLESNKKVCLCDFTGPNVWLGCRCGGK